MTTVTVPAGSADSVQLTGQDAETMRAELLALTVAAGSADARRSAVDELTRMAQEDGFYDPPAETVSAGQESKP